MARDILSQDAAIVIRELGVVGYQFATLPGQPFRFGERMQQNVGIEE